MEGNRDCRYPLWSDLHGLNARMALVWPVDPKFIATVPCPEGHGSRIHDLSEARPRSAKLDDGCGPVRKGDLYIENT